MEFTWLYDGDILMAEKGGIIAGCIVLALFITLAIYYTPILQNSTTPAYKHPCNFLLNQSMESKETFYTYGNYTCTNDRVDKKFSCLYGGNEVCNVNMSGI